MTNIAEKFIGREVIYMLGCQRVLSTLPSGGPLNCLGEPVMFEVAALCQGLWCWRGQVEDRREPMHGITHGPLWCSMHF